MLCNMRNTLLARCMCDAAGRRCSCCARARPPTTAPAPAATHAAAVRLLRRFTGMASASDDRTSRWLGRYTALCFAAVHGLHELVRPILGCGVTRS